MSDYRIMHEGFILILSGGREGECEFVSIGFLIDPHLYKLILCFYQASNYLAYIRIKNLGGNIAILSIYAPHNVRDLEERQNVYSDLFDFWRLISTHGLKF